MLQELEGESELAWSTAQSEPTKSVGLQSKSSPSPLSNGTSSASPRRPKSAGRAGNANQDSPSKSSKRPESNPSTPRMQSPRQVNAPRPLSQTRDVARTAKAVGSPSGIANAAKKCMQERPTTKAPNTAGLSQRREARPSSKDAGNNRVSALEEENERLHSQVEEAERKLGEAWQKIQALEDNCDLWKKRWDQTHDKLEQSWRDYEKLQQRWEETEDLIYAERWARDRDRERLQTAESMLRELGHPLPPATPKQWVKASDQQQVTSPNPVQQTFDGAYSGSSMVSDPMLLNAVQRGSLPSTSVVQEGPFQHGSAHVPSAAEHARKSLFGDSILMALSSSEPLDPERGTSVAPMAQSADKGVLARPVPKRSSKSSTPPR